MVLLVVNVFCSTKFIDDVPRSLYIEARARGEVGVLQRDLRR